MDDLISRQAAIRWVKTECNPYGNPTLDFESGKKVIEHLEQMPSAQKWTPCGERLPEAGKYVLRTIRKFGWNGEEYWSVDIGPYNTNDGSIIAWMPLPKPCNYRRNDSMKTFTEVEKTIARNIDWEYRWMARDRDGNLCIYEEKPEKRNDVVWFSDGYKYIFYFNHLFSAIKWEDDEPTLIRDIYNPPVLNDAEREYLKTVLKPFRGAVKYVEKVPAIVSDDDNRGKEYVFVAFYGRGSFAFPNFDAGSMYAGMKLNKEYKLDELGITY